MDELSVELKARELISKVNPTTFPVSIDAYAAGLTQLILDISSYFAP